MPRHLYRARKAGSLPGGGYSYKRKRNARSGIFALASVCGAVGVATLFSSNTYALDPVDVTITVPASPGQGELHPGSAGIDMAHYQVPVGLSVRNAASFDVYISSNNKDLVGKNFGGKIIGLASASETSMADLSGIANRWGYRWNLGDETGDALDNALNAKGFKGVTGTGIANRDLVVADVATDGPVYNKQLTLEFAATADGNLKSDEYTNEVTISVVATPTQATIFDITTMQEMTHDICQNTPTPDPSTLDGTRIITWALDDSTHYASTLAAAKANSALVPQVTLRDTRGNGHGTPMSYLVRKLADGNCWMVQNLELDFLGTDQDYATAPTSSATTPAELATADYFGTEVAADFRLTDADTDLHSATIWTPARVTQINTEQGTNYKVYATIANARTSANEDRYEYAWKEGGTDGLRSCNVAESNPAWAYTRPAARTAESGYFVFDSYPSGEPFQRTGTLYNWAAATLGSSAYTTADGDVAADSVCPKGWKLPNVLGDDSWKNLLLTYYRTSTDWFVDGASAELLNRIADSPLNLYRGGYYVRDYGYIVDKGYGGGYWTSTVYSMERPYAVEYSYGGTYSKLKYFAGNGLAVRCVAR